MSRIPMTSGSTRIEYEGGSRSSSFGEGCLLNIVRHGQETANGWVDAAIGTNGTTTSEEELFR